MAHAMRLAAHLLLAALLVSPFAAAAPSAAIDAADTCSPSIPGAACALAQTGTLEIVCGTGSCDLVLRGVATVTDPFPVKQVTTKMHIASSWSTVTSSCIGIGLGTADCEIDAQFPFVNAAGTCDRITISTEYERPPLPSVQVSRLFDACRGSDGAFSVQAA